MTDNEIIKALEYCYRGGGCCGCPYGRCIEAHITELALDLINRQKAEIERLNKAIEQCEDSGEYWESKYKTAKAEAIKEALSRVETELGEYYIAKHLVVGTVLDKVRKEMVGDV